MLTIARPLADAIAAEVLVKDMVGAARWRRDTRPEQDRGG
jgi:hypothetical protein